MKQLIKQCYSPILNSQSSTPCAWTSDWADLGEWLGELDEWIGRTWTSELGDSRGWEETRDETTMRYHITSRFTSRFGGISWDITSRFAEFHEQIRRNFTGFHERIRLDLTWAGSGHGRVNWTWTGLGRELDLSSGAKSFNLATAFMEEAKSKILESSVSPVWN